jgi:hypothetical protein
LDGKLSQSARGGLREILCTRGIPMSVIHFHTATISTRDQFIATLTDFGLDRSKILKNAMVSR